MLLVTCLTMLVATARVWEITVTAESDEKQTFGYVQCMVGQDMVWLVVTSGEQNN